MIKKWIPFLVCMLLLLNACGQTNNLDENQSIPIIMAPEFNGYICGFKGNRTFLQLPIFISTNECLSINDIKKIRLVGDEVVFSCNDYNISSFVDSKMEEYQFATLSFRTVLDKVGEYTVNKLNIEFADETTQNIRLGDIIFDIRNEQTLENSGLAMRRFFVNQVSLSSLRISYVNSSNHPITITGFTYPTSLFSSTTIEKYGDFQLMQKEEDLSIPPNSEKTIVVSLKLSQIVGL